MPVTSYGIACCRKNSNGQYEILMIKKKCTYSFSEFVRGIYDINHKQNLIHLFDSMTIDEKICIQTKNFETVWIKSHGSMFDGEKGSYGRGFKKFNALTKVNDGQYLDDIIHLSTNAELLWEIPKGRSDKKEVPVETAIREFMEETHIDKDQYRILFDEGPITYSFTDSGIRYIYVYYIAVMHSNRVSPKFVYSSSHMQREVGNIKFLPTDKIKLLNNNRLYKLCKTIIKKVKRYI